MQKPESVEVKTFTASVTDSELKWFFTFVVVVVVVRYDAQNPVFFIFAIQNHCLLKTASIFEQIGMVLCLRVFKAWYGKFVYI